MCIFLRNMGINASFMGGKNTKEMVLNWITNGGLQILYITPEMYSTCPNFFNQICQCKQQKS